jgi:hypothetical protein
MFPRIPLAAALAIPTLVAQQDATLQNPDAILRELESIEQKQTQTKNSTRTAILGQLQTSAASGPAAAAYYTQAVEAVQFEGQKGKAEAFSDWKKNNSDLLRSKPMQTALVLYLRYAALAVQRKEMDKPETLVPASFQYINDLIAADSVFKDGFPDEARGLLAKPLDASVIAQWLRLGDWLPGDQDFCKTAGDVTGILDKNIRPYLRKAKDPRLLETWDLQMKIEADRISTGRSEHKADRFNNVTAPKLRFQKAQDMIAIGQPNRAVIEMVALVRAHPDHPEFPKWIETIRGTVKPVATVPPTPTPSPAETSPQ